MFEFIKKYYRKKLLAGIKGGRGSTFLNIKDVRSLCFIYEIDGAEAVDNLSGIYNTLKKTGIAFRGLVFVTKKGVLPKASEQKEGESASFLPDSLQHKELHVIKPEELTWLGAFDCKKAEDFFGKEYDLLISFNASNNFTLDYAMRYVKARMSIGMDDGDANYTMVMEGKDKSVLEPKEYLAQVIHYLSVINTVK